MLQQQQNQQSQQNANGKQQLPPFLQLLQANQALNSRGKCLKMIFDELYATMQSNFANITSLLTEFTKLRFLLIKMLQNHSDAASKISVFAQKIYKV
jgi:hypothetical protein